MAYSLVDILEKLRAVEEYTFDLYGEVVAKYENDIKIRTIAKVLRSKQAKNLQNYNTLIEEAKTQDETELAIDFDIYDKVYSLINEFRKRIFIPNVSSASNLVSLSYGYEKANRALLIDIRGRMVREGDENSDYKNLFITNMIHERQKNIETIASFVKENS